ncbi:class I SAM-dependent methyltransferase [uncultured Jatrophihabitans sp.]|uniref:class I SAM-dependent methyltransferase n=1 Tax=uncultured Jatrophihabitans sp. TaxID=1610747 RepID=UPI0035C96536
MDLNRARLGERVFAGWYPVVAGWAERAGQRQVRAELVGQACGRTLEIGAGSGYNLAHYPATVSELVVTDSSRAMLALLGEQLREHRPPVGGWHLALADAGRLPFADAAFDTVVGAFVHCSVGDPSAALAEIARVLRPGGHYLFLEHVRSPDSRLLALAQDVLAAPHRALAGGCSPNRRFGELLERSPLFVEEIVAGSQPRSSPTVRPVLRGVARAW